MFPFFAASWSGVHSSIILLSAFAPASAGSPAGSPGERLDASAHGRGVVESWDVVLERESRRAIDRNDGPPIHSPRASAGSDDESAVPAGLEDEHSAQLGNAPPILAFWTGGLGMFSPAGNFAPPDTSGAVGIDHIVTAVNARIRVQSKLGAPLFTAYLDSFFGHPNVGSARCVFDPHSQRFVVTATDWNSKVFLAVSTSSNASGPWFKTSILVSQGADSLSWPDYPTLGVDRGGIYVSAHMVRAAPAMSVFAIDKAPLVANPPSLGAVTAWRQLAWEGAIQPCVTHGTAVGEYLVSRQSATRLRLRRVDGPMTAPTLIEAGSVVVPFHTSPPDAPAFGSAVDIDTLDCRPMNAVYRNGTVWVAQGIRFNNRAAVRWYELDPAVLAAVQVGTIADSSLGFYYGTISVNDRGDAVLGFSGSDADTFVSAYFTGRVAADPPGQAAPPQVLELGDEPYNILDGDGINRWGSYSSTCVDPVDDFTLWTFQERAAQSNAWGTVIGKLVPGCPGQPDCNQNGRRDDCDLEFGFSHDDNSNGVPDECDPFSGGAFCFGLGSITPCPCAPPNSVPSPSGGPGAGCANSMNPSGAKLIAGGTTAPDTIVLTASVAPSYAGFAILLKSRIEDIAGIPHDDGLRCVSGSLVWFGGHSAGTHGAPQGQWTYPNSVQTLAISIATQQTPGESAFYQLLYRDPTPGFCSAGTTNLSNGFSINWP